MGTIVIGPEKLTFLPHAQGRPDVLAIAILKGIDQGSLLSSQKQSYHFKQISNWRRFQIEAQEKIKIHNTVELYQRLKNVESEILEGSDKSSPFPPLHPGSRACWSIKEPFDEDIERRLLNRHGQRIKETNPRGS